MKAPLNTSLEVAPYGRRRLAAMGQGGYRPATASKRLPPRAAWLERQAAQMPTSATHIALLRRLAGIAVAVSLVIALVLTIGITPPGPESAAWTVEITFGLSQLAFVAIAVVFAVARRWLVVRAP